MSGINRVYLFLVLAILGQHAFSAVIQDEMIFGLSGWNAKARSVRKLVHNANWTTLATISANPHMTQMAGLPMIDVVAVADSPLGGDSTGNIYFYLSSSGSTMQNINVLNNVTALFLQDDGLDCQNQDISSLQPSCGHAVITGNVVQLASGSQDYASGQAAMLSRHPVTANWIQNNNYNLCKLGIDTVYLFDTDGIHSISVSNYYNDKIFGLFDVERHKKQQRFQ